MATIITSMASETYHASVYLDDDGRIYFTADADIDCDGGKNPHKDPCWQPETTLQLNGKSIDADVVPFIVVPPVIVKSVNPIVLGCQAQVTNGRNGKSVLCVVADLGPKKKLGELSPAAARAIGIDPNPNTGGEESATVFYELWPGTPALVNGIEYKLQPYR